MSRQIAYFGVLLGGLAGLTACQKSDAALDEDSSAPPQDSQVEDTEGGLEIVCGSDLEWIDLPIRTHLISSAIDNLNATFTETQALNLLKEAQGFWDQACIRLLPESVRTSVVSPDQEAAYFTATDSTPAPEEMNPLMTAVMPQEDLLQPGWNVMIFREFEHYTSGVYLSQIRSVLWAERLPEAAGHHPNPTVILAHEIGHALGLLHYEGEDKASNLMAADVLQNRSTATLLDEAQIQTARAQALSGDTY